MAKTYLGIDHVGVAVADFSAARALYEDVLGFEILGEEKMPQRGIEVCFVETGPPRFAGAKHLNDGRAAAAPNGTAPPAQNSRIELLGALRDDSEISGFLKKRGPGIHHLCVRVADVEAAAAALRERGARIIGDGVQDGAHGTRVVFIHPKSTGGVLLELVQMPSDRDASEGAPR